MAQPGGADVHVNTALSNISIAYRGQEFIADMVFPQVPVDKQSDDYYIWTKDFWGRNYVQLRTPGDNYPEGSFEVSSTPYAARIYHLAKRVNEEDRNNQDAAIDLDRTAAEWLGEQFALNRESKLAAAIFTSGVWGTSATLVAGEQWDNFDSPDSDPQEVAETAKQTVQKASNGVQVNTCILGYEVFAKLRRHPRLLDLYKNTNQSRLSVSQVAESLEVDQLLVGRAVENTAQEGATYSGGYMWGKSALFLHVATRPGLMTPSAGYTFVWNIDNGDLSIQIRTVRDALRDSDLHLAKHAFDQKVTASDLGYFVGSVVS